MKLSDQRSSQFTKRYFFILRFFLLLILACSVIGKIRGIEMASFTQPTSKPAAAYFREEFRYGGGVVPMGTAEFLYQEKNQLDIHQLELIILDEGRLRSTQRSYNVIGIKWDDNIYQLTIRNDLIYPIMKFIQRRGYIAYTIPVAGVDQKFFDRNHLVPYKEIDLGPVKKLSYVAEEFSSPSHAEFLKNIDIDPSIRTGSMPSKLEKMIMDDINRGKSEKDIGFPISSYVNADFHIKYKAFLVENKREKFIDVGGLPLRYGWSIAKDRSAIIYGVKIFDCPTEQEKYSLQYRAVLFFQTVAILRQFFWDSRQEFDRFLIEVSDSLGKQ